MIMIRHILLNRRATEARRPRNRPQQGINPHYAGLYRDASLPAQNSITKVDYWRSAPNAASHRLQVVFRVYKRPVAWGQEGQTKMHLIAPLSLFLTLSAFSSAEVAAPPDNSTSRESCRMRYTAGCAEADMGGFFRLLAKTPPLEILPGVTVSSSADKKNSSTDSFADFLKSLTLHVSVYNEQAISYIYTQTSEPSTATGRGKKFKFLSIYTVFAIAFALLSALVGKAMTLSLVSLVMAMLTRNLIGNAPPASPVYDIVRRPQVQLAHTQTQEDIYEGAHSYPVGYVFPRVTARSAHAQPYYAHAPRITGSPQDNIDMSTAV